MFKTQAQLTSFSTRADGSASVRFSTQELTDEDFLILKKHLQSVGWLLYKEGEEQIQDSDIPQELVPHKKSKAQILRAVLYRLWEKDNKSLTSNEHYDKMMDKIINNFKDKLNDD